MTVVGSAPTGLAPDRSPPTGDARIRELLERYVTLAGGQLEAIRPGCVELVVPVQDRAVFDGRSRIRLAFSVEAVEDDPDAELAILGSAFVEQLIDAIRTRGARYTAGALAPASAESVESPRLPVAVRRGAAGAASSRIARHRVGRLTARVVIRAGTFLEEHFVESSPFDLVTGLALGADVAAACEARLQAPTDNPKEHPLEASAEIGYLIKRMLGDLEGRLRPHLDGIHGRSERELAHEVGRIERYFTSLLTDIGGRGSELPTKGARDAVDAEKVRRIREEQERHAVRATVHPVQLTEWEVGVQRTEWRVESTDRHTGTLTAQRTLAGDMAWVVACPSCGVAAPREATVCVHDHVACDRCARECSVCVSSFCADHGIAACHLDGAPCCEQHARTCPSCLRAHCSAHEGVCTDGGHAACVTCLAGCAHCGAVVCNQHAETTAVDAPRGRWRLCNNCVRTCEGGSGEVVGPDEVTGCASCERVVCERHQARCAVDGNVHCSRHLRRTDRSRRLVCERDRAACTYEPNAILAIDEVGPCATCGVVACSTHAGVCVEDQSHHCLIHLQPLGDRPGAMACEAHRTVCHVDGRTFSLRGTAACLACARLTCATHMRRCTNCYRTVCTAEYFASDTKRCGTCARLAVVAEPSDSVIAAAVALRGADGARPKSWKVSRDAAHLVVELDLGWTRRIVFAVRHGDAEAASAVAHSVLGARVLR